MEQPTKHKFILRRIDGFSLLEVLIATFILAFGLLGIMGVCVHSFKSVGSSYQRTLDTSRIIERHEYR